MDETQPQVEAGSIDRNSPGQSGLASFIIFW
jgi:hypothetical protein